MHFAAESQTAQNTDIQLIKIDTIIITILIVLNLLILVNYKSIKEDLNCSLQINYLRNNVNELANKKIPQNLHLIPNITNLDSNVSFQLQKSKFNLVILFEPNQCGACLEEKVLWNEIKKSGIIPLYGITYLEDKLELDKYLKDSKTDIPVYQDTLAIIGKYLTPKGVPVKLLANENHEIIFADYVRTTKSERNDFIKFYLKTN